jgi:hypothetical protein
MTRWASFAAAPRRRVHRPPAQPQVGLLDGGARGGRTSVLREPSFSQTVRDEVRRQRQLSFPPRIFPTDPSPTTDDRIRRRARDLQMRDVSERSLVAPAAVVEQLGGRRVDDDRGAPDA